MPPLSINNRLLTLLALVIGAYLTFSLIGVALGAFAFGVGLEELTSMSSYRSVQALKIVQVVTTTGVFIVVPFIFSRIIRTDFHNYYRLDGVLRSDIVAITAFTIAASLPLIGWMAMLNNSIELPSFLSGVEDYFRSAEDQAMRITKAFLEMDTPLELAYNLALVALLPAFGEELLFRGALQRLMIEKARNIHWGIWISAALFSAFHNQFYGFFPRMFLGAAFGYIVIWAGSLWYAIIAHFVNNSIGVLLHYYVLKNHVSEEVEELGASPDHILFVVISVVVTAAGCYLLWSKRTDESYRYY